MNCKNCGYGLSAGEKFCQNCGNPVGGETLTQQASPQMEPTNPAPAEMAATAIPNMNESLSSQMETVPQMAMVMDPSPAPVMPEPAMVSSSPNVTSPIVSKKNNLIPLLVGLILIIAVGIGAYFLGSQKTNSADNNDSNNNTNINTGGTDNNDLTPTPTANTSKVTIGGFTFQIPYDYAYELDGETLYIGDYLGNWVAGIEIVDIAYPMILTNKDQLKTYFENNNGQVGIVEEKNYGGATILTFEVTIDNESGIYAYTKADTSKSFYIFAFNTSYTIDYSILDKIGSIFANAATTDRSNSMGSKASSFATPDLKKIIK